MFQRAGGKECIGCLVASIPGYRASMPGNINQLKLEIPEKKMRMSDHCVSFASVLYAICRQSVFVFQCPLLGKSIEQV